MRTDAMLTAQPKDPENKASLALKILDPKWDGRSTFTVEEAGEICGISRPSAYAAAKNGTLPTVRIGRRCIVPRHALEHLLLGVQSTA
jgi:excisionase family DNA binding protein